MYLLHAEDCQGAIVSHMEPAYWIQQPKEQRQVHKLRHRPGEGSLLVRGLATALASALPLGAGSAGVIVAQTGEGFQEVIRARHPLAHPRVLALAIDVELCSTSEGMGISSKGCMQGLRAFCRPGLPIT